MSSAKDFRPKARRPRGFQDRRGASLQAERALIEKVSAVYEQWGFERLDTGAFEYADALGKFLPDQDRPNEGVFALQDDDEQWMSLRYDLTAPLARFVAENFDALPKPYRRWAAGPVWRNEKPGPGRFREFWQCDADTVGAPGPAADAEMIAMACAALEAAGIARGGYRLKVSTRGLLDAVLEANGIGAGDFAKRLIVLRAIDKFDRLGADGVAALLGKGRKDESGDFTKGAELSSSQSEAVLALVQAGAATASQTFDNLARVAGTSEAGIAALNELRAIDEVLRRLGADETQVAFDPTIVRGLEYYTGPVFEAELLAETTDEDGNRIRFGSVGGGGRYDDLVSRFRGESIPATGFSIGVSRLAAALEAAQRADAQAEGPVVVLVMDRDRVGDSFAIADDLRKAGVRAEVYLGGAGMKAQMRYADKRNAPIVVIEGGDEKAKGVVTLRDLKRGADLAKLSGDDRAQWLASRGDVQVEVPRAEVGARVKAMLQA